MAWRHQAITWTEFRLLTSDVLWHLPESNFTASVQVTSPYDEFENYTSKFTGTSLPGDNELRGMLITWYIKKVIYRQFPDRYAQYKAYEASAPKENNQTSGIH